MSAPEIRRWHPTFLLYRWRHVLWSVPLLALLGLLVLHRERLRWDHAMAVVMVRPAGFCTLGGYTAPRAATPIFVTATSPEVLQGAVADAGLAVAWRMSETQAVARLRSLVSCEAEPGTAFVEVKVRKDGPADSIKACDAIVRRSMERATAEQASQCSAEIERWKAEAEKTQAEIEAIRGEFRGLLLADKRPQDELLEEFNSKQRYLEQLKMKILSEEMDLKVKEEPIVMHMATHWPGHPATRHLMEFGISAAWTFGVSVLLSVALAYLLEAALPRKLEKKAC